MISLYAFRLSFLLLLSLSGLLIEVGGLHQFLLYIHRHIVGPVFHFGETEVPSGPRPSKNWDFWV